MAHGVVCWPVLLPYLITADLDADFDADWYSRRVDARGHGEEQQWEPDDEEQDEQDQSTETVLGQRSPRPTTWRRQSLL